MDVFRRLPRTRLPHRSALHCLHVCGRLPKAETWKRHKASRPLDKCEGLSFPCSLLYQVFVLLRAFRRDQSQTSIQPSPSQA